MAVLELEKLLDIGSHENYELIGEWLQVKLSNGIDMTLLEKEETHIRFMELLKRIGINFEKPVYIQNVDLLEGTFDLIISTKGEPRHVRLTQGTSSLDPQITITTGESSKTYDCHRGKDGSFEPRKSEPRKIESTILTDIVDSDDVICLTQAPVRVAKHPEYDKDLFTVKSNSYKLDVVIEYPVGKLSRQAKKNGTDAIKDQYADRIRIEGTLSTIDLPASAEMLFRRVLSESIYGGIESIPRLCLTQTRIGDNIVVDQIESLYGEPGAFTTTEEYKTTTVLPNGDWSYDDRVFSATKKGLDYHVSMTDGISVVSVKGASEDAKSNTKSTRTMLENGEHAVEDTKQLQKIIFNIKQK